MNLFAFVLIVIYLINYCNAVSLSAVDDAQNIFNKTQNEIIPEIRELLILKNNECI